MAHSPVAVGFPALLRWCYWRGLLKRSSRQTNYTAEKAKLIRTLETAALKVDVLARSAGRRRFSPHFRLKSQYRVVALGLSLKTVQQPRAEPFIDPP